jgi:hypothetical protein
MMADLADAVKISQDAVVGQSLYPTLPSPSASWLHTCNATLEYFHYPTNSFFSYVLIWSSTKIFWH